MDLRELPSPPAPAPFPALKRQRGRSSERAVAIAGIVCGFLVGLVVCGLFAWLSYWNWQRGNRRYPLFAWFAAFASLGLFASSMTSLPLMSADQLAKWSNAIIVPSMLITGVVGASWMARHSLPHPPG
jgi:hypothetical protein